LVSLLLKLRSDLGRKLILEFPVSTDLHNIMKVRPGFLSSFILVFSLERKPGIYFEVEKRRGRRKEKKRVSCDDMWKVEHAISPIFVLKSFRKL